MTYQKTTWVDHVVDPVTGEIVQQGTKFTATRANKFEQGIADAHSLVESLAQQVVGSSVVSGLTFTSSGLTANYTAGTAYVNGVRFDVAAGSIQLNPTQGQYIYLDSDGAVKKTTSQTTAQAKCPLWYFATDASGVITSTDSRSVVTKDTFVKQVEVATNGANKIPRLDAQGKGAFSITGDAASVGGKVPADFVPQTDVAANGANKIPRLDAQGKGAFSITGDAATIGGKSVGNGANQIPVRDGNGDIPIGAGVAFHPGNHGASGDPHPQYVRETLVAATDLNTVIETGFYDGNNLSNAPIGGYLYIQVIRHTSDGSSNRWVQQIAYDFNSNNSYTRNSRGGNGTWSAWKLIGQAKLKRYLRGVPDSNGKYKEVEYVRPDGTRHAYVTFSNPDSNGNYQTQTIQYYNSAGSSIAETETRTLGYDTNGIMVSDV